VTREQLVHALSLQERESVAYWDAFDIYAFFEPIGGKWSPADNVRHLVKSDRAIAEGFWTSPLILRFKFGRSVRPSMTYEEFVARYLKALRDGGTAGAFAPSRRRMHNLDGWRARIMNDFVRGQRDIRRRLAVWSEESLDRSQLPHPLLGPITMREMAFFVLYHQRHHIQVVKRNLAARPTVVLTPAPASPHRLGPSPIWSKRE
jgi:hypothetical protein